MRIYSHRARQIRIGVRIEIVTIIWMIGEAVIALGAGLLSGSPLLLAFGLAAVMALARSTTRLWRLAISARVQEKEDSEQRAQHAPCIICVALAGLALYALLTAIAWFRDTGSPGRITTWDRHFWSFRPGDVCSGTDETPDGGPPG